MANEGLKLTQTRLNQLNPRHFSLTFRARTPQTLPWTWRRWCLTTPWRPLSWWMWHPKTALGWWKPSRCCSRLHSQPLCCWAAPTERTDGSWHRTRAARRWDWDHNVISRAVNLKKKKKNSISHKTDFKSSHKFLSFISGIWLKRSAHVHSRTLCQFYAPTRRHPAVLCKGPSRTLWKFPPCRERPISWLGGCWHITYFWQV